MKTTDRQLMWLGMLLFLLGLLTGLAEQRFTNVRTRIVTCQINRAREFSIPLQILIGSIAFAGASQSSTATAHSTNVSGRATASSGLRSQATPQSDSISAAKIMAMESTR